MRLFGRMIFKKCPKILPAQPPTLLEKVLDPPLIEYQFFYPLINLVKVELIFEKFHNFHMLFLSNHNYSSLTVVFRPDLYSTYCIPNGSTFGPI